MQVLETIWNLIVAAVSGIFVGGIILVAIIIILALFDNWINK